MFVMELIAETNFKRAQEEIARCAYLVWEREGRPEGRALVHWMQAEDQLLAAGRIVAVPDNFPPSSGTNSRPPFHRRRYGLVLTQKHGS
jgi:hypothetical protein